MLCTIWIMLGESEFTMDEVDTIQEYLISQAGSDTEVILGLGYDENLGDNIGITIIATGFENQESTSPNVPSEKKISADDKITFTLDMEKTAIKPAFAIEEKAESMDIVEEPVHSIAATADIVDGVDTVQKVVEYDFSSSESVVLELDITNNVSPVLNENKSSIPEISTIQQEEKPTTYQTSPNSKPLSSGFLVKPTIIYENESKQPTSSSVAMEEATSNAAANFIQEEEKKNEDEGMQLVYRELSVEAPAEIEIPETTSSSVEEQIVINEDEAQRAKAAERLYKLRNLSYNFNAADPNNEYENVPAYVRHNFHVNSNTMATVEKFYSNYAIETDDNNNTHISTINTFLEGKKPD